MARPSCLCVRSHDLKICRELYVTASLFCLARLSELLVFEMCSTVVNKVKITSYQTIIFRAAAEVYIDKQYLEKTLQQVVH